MSPRFSPEIQELAREQERARNLKPGSPAVLKLQSAYEDGMEKQFTREASLYLQGRGYWPRTEKCIRAGKPPNGFFIHYHKAQGNPYILDLLVVKTSKPYRPPFEAELKTKDGRVREIQALLLEQGGKVLRSMTQLDYEFKAWEAGS